MLNNNSKHIIVGIDPAGIGKTGIVIKSFNYSFPKRWRKTIEATNPVEAADKISKYIEDVKNTLPDEFSLFEVVVEVPHGGKEMFKQVKATRELVGILRYLYRSKFKGHLPNHKDKKYKDSLKINKGYYSDHEMDAECILVAHLKEKETNLFCENYLGVVKNESK